MERRRTQRTALVALIGVLVVLVSVILTQGRAGQWLASRTGPVLGPVFARISSWGGSVGALVHRIDTAHERDQLRMLTDRVTSLEAQNTALVQENDALRDAVGLSDRVPGVLIQAQVFSSLRDGLLKQVVLNKGSVHGVAVDDVVMTAGGVLVGRVTDVFSRHALVRLVGDPDVEVTGRIAGTQVSGLVHVDPSGRLALDLVQKGEVVKEDQVVVTSGNDQYPPGLIVGVVRSVDAASATLFQQIRLNPSVPERLGGLVVVIHQ